MEVTPSCCVTSAGLFWYLRAAALAAGHSVLDGNVGN